MSGEAQRQIWMHMPGSLQRRYLNQAGVWLLFAPEGDMDCEILVRGDLIAPAADALALLARILPKREDLTRQATRFLDVFVDRHRFAAGNDCFFTGVRIGLNANDPASQFWLTFDIDGDTCGEWSVAMREIGEDRYCPLVLIRRNF
jgi:hypothetical protein